MEMTIIVVEVVCSSYHTVNGLYLVYMKQSVMNPHGSFSMYQPSYGAIHFSDYFGYHFSQCVHS